VFIRFTVGEKKKRKTVLLRLSLRVKSVEASVSLSFQHGPKKNI